MIEIVVYGEAQTAGSKRAGVTKAGRRFVRDDNPNSAEWKRQVAQAAGAAMDGRSLLEGPLTLDVVFYRPRPAGHFGKRGLRRAAPRYPITRPDATKLLRAVEDALTWVVWRDDSQVVSQHVEKHYGEPARAEIRVTRLVEEEVTNGDLAQRSDREHDHGDEGAPGRGDAGGRAGEPAEMPGARSGDHAPGDRPAVADEGALGQQALV